MNASMGGDGIKLCLSRKLWLGGNGDRPALLPVLVLAFFFFFLFFFLLAACCMERERQKAAPTPPHPSPSCGQS